VKAMLEHDCAELHPKFKVGIPIPPPTVGHWLIGGPYGMHFPLPKRPRWLTRVLMAWFVEWQWRDAERT
jgi:hypothetical protein